VVHQQRFRRTAQKLALLLLVGCMLGMNASGDSSSDEALLPSQNSSRRLDHEELVMLAPYVVQIVNLANLDPGLASKMVPEPWIDFMLAGAIGVEAEVAERPPETTTPIRWPIGPWPTSATLADTIRAFDPTAVADLYRALRPRMTKRCRRIGSSPKACGHALRATVSRLSAPAVLAHSTGRRAVHPLTATQIELSRLGEPAVVAVRDQLQILGRALWGAPRTTIN
jgi:hypothetical protein